LAAKSVSADLLRIRTDDLLITSISFDRRSKFRCVVSENFNWMSRRPALDWERIMELGRNFASRRLRAVSSVPGKHTECKHIGVGVVMTQRCHWSALVGDCDVFRAAR
jgi:hypothetical protein